MTRRPFVQPLRARDRFVQRAPAGDPRARYTFIECLSNIKNVNGVPQQLNKSDPNFIDYYGRPWAQNWEKWFEQGWTSPPMMPFPRMCWTLLNRLPSRGSGGWGSKMKSLCVRLVGGLMLMLATLAAADSSSPKRVLMLHSFGPEFGICMRKTYGCNSASDSPGTWSCMSNGWFRPASRMLTKMRRSRTICIRSSLIILSTW